MRQFLFVFSIILLVYGCLNYYIGRRLWQTLSFYVSLNHSLYWLIFWSVALSYLMGRMGQKYLPAGVSTLLSLVGSYWLGAMFYFLQILVVMDLIRALMNVLKLWPGGVKGFPPAAGLTALLLVIVILGYGFWNARNPQVVHYDITIPKKAGQLDKLHVVMVSDLHLGKIMDNRRLEKMVEIVNALNPDLILLPGDVIDENVGLFVEQNMMATFRRLNPKYGKFAALGNHEYIGRKVEEAIHYLEESGIQVLQDSYIKVEDSFYVVGRDERASERFSGRKRKSLAEVMTGIDYSLPIILLNHQPVELEEAKKEGVDLQLSGHTHRGQLFPNQLITSRIFEKDWGYLRKEELQVIVSSGFGTWGPPIRVGNRPEVVDIVIHFSP
ncbi:MAG: metallophosphoesterase [Bacillota bacterium]